jgi:OmpA-OmpF porin, OOP family
MLRALTCLLLLTATAAADSKAKPNITVTEKTIEVGTPIYFETGKAVIKSESFATLDAIAATLAADTHLALIEVQSHTDERGADKWNLEMSQKRADAIVQALVDRKIDAHRLRAVGYGETQPVDRHHNEAAWAKNRRTVFLILQRTT